MTPIELQARREALGLTTQQMAFQLNTTHANYLKWEQGNRQIDSAIITAVTALEEQFKEVIERQRRLIQIKSQATQTGTVELEIPTNDADAAIMLMPHRWPATLIRTAATHASTAELEQNGIETILVPFRL